ncbi:T9SS type A sorting domain-containing protein [Halocola ammonii]
MRLLFTCISLFIASSLLAQYTTPDNGLTIDFDYLVENSNGTVVMDGDDYLVTDSVTVSATDILEETGDLLVKISPNALITIQGGFTIDSENGLTFTWAEENSHYKGFRFESGSVIDLNNATFEYGGGLRVLTEDFTMDNCTVQYQEMIASTGGALGFSDGTPSITNSTFIENQTAAINSPANGAFAPIIDNCTFQFNGASIVNKSQINLGPSGQDTIIISNCTIEGHPDYIESGGIAVALLAGGEGHAVIENNEIFNNRYGIAAIGGNLTTLIVGNNIYDNNIQGEPLLGGSGINMSGTSQNMATVTENTISGNLWGMTLQGETMANLGDTTEANFNPGLNVFEDNGNGGVTYALFNNTPNDLMAMNNCWMGEQEITVEDAESVISHQFDDEELGLVTFTPLGCVDPIGVEEIELAAVTVYPVPTSGQLSISAESQVQYYRIFSISGRMIDEGKSATASNETDIDVSGLNSGAYILQVETANGLKTIRFVKE